MENKKISLIIPCYNEQDSLPFFYDETTNVLRAMTYDYELLFIDDGSTDQTLSLLMDFAKKDDHINYLSFSRNFGKEAAMYAGLCNSDGDYVAIMDADMQDPPDLLPQMLEALNSGNYDSVATRRINRSGEPVLRSWFAKIFYKLINRISDTDVTDGARDFRLMKREMVNAIIAMGERNRFSKGIFGWVGFRTYWLPYQNVERIAGNTKWNFLALATYAVDGIINFSQTPISISSYFGILMTFISFLLLLVIVIKKFLFGDPVDGWTSTVCIIVFIGGIQLFCLGVIGQYIAKTYIETKQRPHYIISTTNKDNIEPIK